MNLRIPFLLSLLLFSIQYVAGQDSINIALYSTPFVKYFGSMPPTPDPYIIDTSKTNPQKLIDKNYFTYLEFPSGPISNVSSFVGFELQDTFSVTRIRIVNLLNSPIAYRTRIRGYQLFGAGQDTAQWTLIDENPNNSDTVSTFLDIVPADKSKKWKYYKLVITKQGNPNSTVFSEIQIYASVGNVKAISSISFLPTIFSNGENFIPIQWGNFNMTPDDKVNIYYKLSTESSYQPLALNEVNDGTYNWNTTFLPDGEYKVLIEPAVILEKLSLSAPVTVQNYSNLSLTLLDQNFQYDIDISGYYSSAFLDDSLDLQWSYSTTVQKNFSYRFRYSLDSGKQWTHLTLISDTSKRKFAWKVPEIKQTALYSFFEMGIYIDTLCVARTVTRVPRILVGGWGFSTAPWVKKSHYTVTSSLKGSVGVFQSQINDGPRIVLGPSWMAKGNGDSSSIPFWNAARTVGPLAVADIDGNGSAEVISSSVVTEDGSRLFYDTLSAYGSDPVIVDMNNDGKKEIVYHSKNSFTTISHDGKNILAATIPPSSLNSYTLISAADLNGDGQREYLYGSSGGNSIYAFDQSGVGIGGYPIVIADIIRTSPLISDLFKSGEPNIIVAANKQVYCFKKNGGLLNGFPFTVPEAISAQAISIADVDNDGFVDIVFSTASKKIYCIDRFGTVLNGWPRSVNDLFLHYRCLYFMNPPRGELVYMSGTLSAPYILSIDGDKYNEIIVFSTNGMMIAFDHLGNLKPGFPVFVGAYPNISAHFDDVDNNGTLNAIIPIAYKNEIYMMNMDFGPGTYNSARMPWPTERQNVERTGIAPYPVPVGVQDEIKIIPTHYSLMQNFPNPFNPQTTIAFDLAETGMTSLKVYDVLGREVRTIVNERLDAGTHTRNFSAADLNSGLYFYTLRSGKYTETKKMLMVK